MELDLDSFFGGQGCTDLDDFDEPSPAEATPDEPTSDEPASDGPYYAYSAITLVQWEMIRDSSDLIINAACYKPRKQSSYVPIRPSPLRQAMSLTDEIDDLDSLSSSSSSSSSVSDGIDIDTPPSSPEPSSPIISASAVADIPTAEIDTTMALSSIERPVSTTTSSSGMYAATIIGISVILSFW
ncbi:MAG: hypothetical protein Q9213_006289 [Squamulea squamosa]